MSAGSPAAAAPKPPGAGAGAAVAAGGGGAGAGAGEPCSHPVQVSGLCAICGVELETLPEDERAGSAADEPVSILHSHASLKVTRSEAARMHAQTTSELLNTRRLALIVDLDQTVIHATVDPTVGEWMKDRSNPNHGALRDVKRFRLGMDGKPVPKVTKAMRRARTKAKAAVVAGKATNGNGSDEHTESKDDGSDDEKDTSMDEGEKDEDGEDDDSEDSEDEDEEDDNDPALGCWYYIKPRPGLIPFLRNLSTLYELHVYTMGTRSYATSVCAIIDPDGTLFADRILSRDENDDGASATASSGAAAAVAAAAAFRKSLARLFPVDTSMVVIIDDRADVWKWSPNLVKVVPFDFFVGIGDINASFLPAPPPSTELPTPPTTDADSSPAEASDPSSSPASSSTTEGASGSAAVDATSALAEGGADAAQRVALEIQAAERPLAKMQEALEEEKDAQDAQQQSEAGPSSERGSSEGATGNQQGNGEKVGSSSSSSSGTKGADTASAIPVQHPQRAAVLKEDDRELDRLQRVLNDIHSRWYVAWDTVQQESRRRGGDLGDSLARMPDAANIIAEMKAQVLKGCHIVFSGVVPLGQNLELSEPWRTATEFGARCHRDLTSSVTHLVAARGGTAKVYQAQRQKLPRIWIVKPRWLTESCERWTKGVEDRFSLEGLEGGGLGGGAVDEKRSSGKTGALGLSVLPSPTADEAEGDNTRMAADDTDDDGEGSGGAGVGAGGGGGGATGGGGGGPSMSAFGGFDSVDWGEAADEVDAFLDGLDEEGDTTDGGYGSDQSIGRNPPQAERGAKRARTSTEESDLGEGNNASAVTTAEHEQPQQADGRSPLSKRRRIASGRVGQSKLKHSFDPSAMDSDDDDDEGEDDDGAGADISGGSGRRKRTKADDHDVMDSEADDDGDDEDEGGNAKKKKSRRQEVVKHKDEDEDEEEDDEEDGQRRHSLFRKRAAGAHSSHVAAVDDDADDGGAAGVSGMGREDDDEGSVGSVIDESFLDGLADEIALDLEEGD
ncbi:unnamed protein product [Tilletia controversa]|uniref:protein-serine/threonine phosphatase n=1 Tax=Tilletia controversa TaxID=13291 RepID=A0A8X7T061_9BASI|nr:hypothetical protein CF328_g151 [Tilletia controversa]KAE8255424.1 hypothetical protein A4X06_0g434 [Tilletia controversa]CAD6913183.1 unnamed protein product [Tilletia controversa]CAD6918219.1 unnamed protein product [Tilletia controversa]CAD6921168.1 unnamed protein product [Tilletia controversa]